jgi:hypothetical protein
MAAAGSVATRVVAILVALTLIGTPLALHFTQKRHDRLVTDVDVRFPESQPLVGGEVFATTLADIVEHELSGGTGWRPNDFPLWGPSVAADNNANRQLGIIKAVRETTRVMKDHLTKVSSDEYDPNLIQADRLFRNDEYKMFFPSAESRYAEGVQHLRDYVAGLQATPPTSKPINRRNVELIRLFQTWTDLLGDAHGALYRPQVGFFETDDVFYEAQGIAHVVYHMSKAVKREYPFAQRQQIVDTLLDEVIAALGQAAVLKPVVVLDGAPDGVLANHRRNLDAYITEARQKMYSIREELEK